MTYTVVPAANLAVDKPARSADMLQFRTNQEDHETRIASLELKSLVTGNDIREHFLGVAGATGIDTSHTWTTNTAAGGTIVVASEHSGVFTGGTYAYLSAGLTKLRVVKSEEYLAYMSARIKRTGADANSYAFGWQDDGLAADATRISDTSDFVGVRREAGGNWEAITANGGVTSTSGAIGTATNWHEIRLEFTCSATAGNRKVEVYLDDVLNTTLNTDANMPTMSLCPVVGIAVAGNTLKVDYIEFGFRTVPTAA